MLFALERAWTQSLALRSLRHPFPLKRAEQAQGAASTTVAQEFRVSCNANSHTVKPTFEYAASVLTLAFSTDPPVRWMYRDVVTCFPSL